MTNTDRLRVLFQSYGQSPWIDNLSRAHLQDGSLQRWKDRGIRGITSNPTIFQKAITGSDLYDDELRSSINRHQDAHSAYWDLVCTDIAAAADLFRDVYDESHGEDGFVSVEVSPSLAYDVEGTVAAAEALWLRLARANVMIKIPATNEGIEATRRVVALGINVNVTLIFGLEEYIRVLDAHVSGLELLAQTDPERVSNLASVASFFISRVDTEIDTRLTGIGSVHALSLRGQGAVSQAKMAYDGFTTHCATERWRALLNIGARPQRPLWASTSTKNAAYPDTLYVDELIGPSSVNTLPEDTANAFSDHGRTQRTIDRNLEHAIGVWDGLEKAGIDRRDVASVLERQGVEAFQKSFTDLVSELELKARQII
jgi:transaldolase